MPAPFRGWGLRPWLALGVIVLALGGLAALLLGGDDDVSNPDVEFVDTGETAPAPPDQTPALHRHPADDGFEWPVYGFTKARTHVLPLRRPLRPPFRHAWSVRGRVLLEFTPVLCGRRLFLLKNNGALYAISRATGRVLWKRKLGALAAASPACSHGSVFAVLLLGRQGGGGRVVGLRARTGRIRWARALPSRAESSPLLDRGRLYFGTEDGTVYALHAGDGSIRWRYRADGAVKGAVALDDGLLYFGDYGGKVHAVRRSNGSRVWRSSTSGTRFGLSSGNFYSTAAVAFGRVYIGNTDGNVYSFSADDGALAWRRSTGGFVYASPAVGAPLGGRPTVYIGSYDGRFYALDARSGNVRWSRQLGSKISGAATLVGDLVFFSDLAHKSTWALGARTGKTVWKTGRGAFNPVISDGRRLYFVGYSSLFGLDGRGAVFDPRGAVQRRVVRERIARSHRLAQQRRQAKYRSAVHGHRHAPRAGGPPHCHLHSHRYRVGRKTIVLRHFHCHRHVGEG